MEVMRSPYMDGATDPINRPSGETFLASITAIGDEVAATGPGAGYWPHAWKELVINPLSRAYDNHEYGRSGSATESPAFSPDGAKFAVHDLVWIRVRGYVGLDWAGTPGTDSSKTFHGLVYDIIGKASPPGNTTNPCNDIQKIYGKVFSCSGTLYQKYTIKQGCTTISEGCEQVPTSGGCCASLCNFSADAAACMKFNISGVIATCSGFGVCTHINGDWCLAKSTLGPAWIAQDNTSGASAIINMNNDGTATLNISYDVPPSCGGGFNGSTDSETYHSTNFNCTTGGTFSLVTTTVQGCGGWPATINVTAGSCCCSCSAGPTGWMGTLSGFSNLGCANCTALNTDFCLSSFDGCTYTGGHTVANCVCTPCLLPMVNMQIWVNSKNCTANLYINYTGGFVEQSGDAVYQSLTWDQTAASNTFNLVSSTGACGAPATITVNRANATGFPPTCSAASGGGGGGGGGGTHDCSSCGMHTTAILVIPTAPWSDGTCTVCDVIDNGGVPITLTQTAPGVCSWINVTGPGVVCGGVPTIAQYQLVDNGVTGWEVTLSVGSGAVVATYFLAYASWSCSGANTLNRVSLGAACASAPITVQVTLS